MEQEKKYLYQVKEFPEEFLKKQRNFKFQWLPEKDCWVSLQSVQRITHNFLPADNEYMINFPKEYFEVVSLEELLTLKDSFKNPRKAINLYNHFVREEVIRLGWFVSLNNVGGSVRLENDILKVNIKQKYKSSLGYYCRNSKNETVTTPKKSIYTNIRIPTTKEIKAAEEAWEKGIYPIKIDDIVGDNTDSYKFNNCKIKVNSPEESKLIQKRLFELGYKWTFYKDKIIRYIKKPSLFIYGNNLTYGDNLSFFDNHHYKEITLKDLGLDVLKSFDKTLKETDVYSLNHSQEYPLTPDQVFKKKNKLEIPLKDNNKKRIEITLSKKSSKLQF